MPYRPLPLEERRRVAVRLLYADGETEPPAWVDEVLLRPGHVAALFQVSRRTLNEWARRGRLPSIVTPGGHRRYRLADVRALLEAQEWRPAGSGEERAGR